MCEVSTMGVAFIVGFWSTRVMLMLDFPILKKNFSSNFKFAKKIEKCIQVGFGSLITNQLSNCQFQIADSSSVVNLHYL